VQEKSGGTDQEQRRRTSDGHFNAVRRKVSRRVIVHALGETHTRHFQKFKSHLFLISPEQVSVLYIGSQPIFPLVEPPSTLHREWKHILVRTHPRSRSRSRRKSQACVVQGEKEREGACVCASEKKHPPGTSFLFFKKKGVRFSCGKGILGRKNLAHTVISRDRLVGTGKKKRV